MALLILHSTCDVRRHGDQNRTENRAKSNAFRELSCLYLVPYGSLLVPCSQPLC